MDSNMWSIEKQLLKHPGDVQAEHCHPANEVNMEALKLKIMFKSKAKESTTTIPILYNEMLQELRTLET